LSLSFFACLLSGWRMVETNEPSTLVQFIFQSGGKKT
jgi:hypothetical protein